MEKSLRLLDFKEHLLCTQVHDYRGATMLSINTSVKAASRELIRIFQDYYPETLAKKFFINVPSFFETVYSLFSSFIDEQTRQKFIICAGGYRQKMLDAIDPGQVPVLYGGLASDPHSCLDQPTNLTPLEVKAGKSEQVSIQVAEGQKYSWDVIVLDKDIRFSVHVQSDQNQSVIVEPTRLDHHQHTYESVCEGTLTLEFCNKFSYFNKKTIWYTLRP